MEASKSRERSKCRKSGGEKKANSGAKSVAQRVMDMATSPGNDVVVAAAAAEDAPAAGESATKPTTSSDSNSLGSNDHEVEAITNRAARLEILPASQSDKQAAKNSSSSSSLLFFSPQTPDQKPAQQQNHHFHHNRLPNNHHHHNHNPPRLEYQQQQRQQLSATDLMGQVARHQMGRDGKCSDGRKDASEAQQIISLDTKIPHPLAANSEEVTYYNDTSSIEMLVEPKQVGGSLDNNTKPRLLAATIASRRQHGQRLNLIDAPLPKTAISCQQLRNEPADDNQYVNGDQQPRQPVFECGVYMPTDHYDQVAGDEEPEELRYDNASVERALGGQSAARNITTAVSISTASTKAKSAPATPCNVTPITFHQHNPHEDSPASQLANTMPPDIRRNISATCARVLPSSATGQSCGGGGDDEHQVDVKTLDELSERGQIALRDKDYQRAVRLFSQCLDLASHSANVAYLEKNFKIYARRAEAHFKLAKYNEAIEDSMAARDLNPRWTQAYYLQGKAQFMSGKHADSMAVLAFGLTQAPSSCGLFEALLEAALSYSDDNFKQDFEPKLAKLRALKLDRRPFVVVAVLGQELLAKKHSQHAAIVLESALKISNSLELAAAGGGVLAHNSNRSSRTSNATPPVSSSPTASEPSPAGQSQQQRRFRGSVLSSIARAYCSLKDYDKAISYMLKELDIESELEDVAGQCRVLANLGYTYYKTRQFNASLEAHRKQLNMAMKTHLFAQASQALTAIGHVHVARNDFASALTSHTRCLDILKQLGDTYHSQQFKELLAIGHINSLMGDFNAASERYHEAVQLINCAPTGKGSGGHVEAAERSVMLTFNRAFLALKRQQFNEARKLYWSVMESIQNLSKFNANKANLYEMRTANAMGHTLRLLKRFDEATNWFERQLQLAELLACQLGQSQALCNLGMINQQHGDYQKAWRLFSDNLKLVERNAHLKAYALSYLGSTYFLMGRYNDAIMHYETSLNLFRDLEYCSAEQKTIELNLAVVRERMGHTEAMAHPTMASTTSATNTTINTPSANQTTHTKKVMMLS